MTSRHYPYHPPANEQELNRILGTASDSLTGQVTVRSVNPKKLTCNELLVHGHMRLFGGMETSLVGINGNSTNTAIRFAGNSPNTGVYSPAPDTICVAIQGTRVACFTPTGLAAQSIYGPNGTIDFNGSALTNCTISTNPNAYTMVGETVQTFDATPKTALVVPLASAFVCAWELTIKVIYANATHSPDNGNYTFRIRAWNSIPEPQLIISAQYDITKYGVSALDGVNINAVVSGNSVNIQVIGIPSLIINWIAKCDIVVCVYDEIS